MKSFNTAIFLAIFSIGAHAVDKVPQVPDFARDWIGEWQHAGKGEYIRIEPTRLVEYCPIEGLAFMRIRISPGKLTVIERGTEREIGVSTKNKNLILKIDDAQHEYLKVEKARPELELHPIIFGNKAILPDAAKQIRAELVQREQEDQAVRKNPARHGESEKVDINNTAYLKQVVQEYGWIDATRFGADASHAAFLIVQHSGDLPLMVAALPEVEKDAKSGKLVNCQPFALLYDRTMISLGKKQRYGTQLYRGEGKIIVLALEDKEKVETFRREIGIFPFSEYLAIFKQQFGTNEVSYEEE